LELFTRVSLQQTYVLQFYKLSLTLYSSLIKASKTHFQDHKEILDVAKALNSSNNFVSQSYSYLLDAKEEQIVGAATDEEKTGYIAEAKGICDMLQENDMIRSKYWAFRSGLLSK
jgi:hypothetical protein